jgi:hypothetical protein
VTDQIGTEEIVCEMHGRRSVLSKQPANIYLNKGSGGVLVLKGQWDSESVTEDCEA